MGSKWDKQTWPSTFVCKVSKPTYNLPFPIRRNQMLEQYHLTSDPFSLLQCMPRIWVKHEIWRYTHLPNENEKEWKLEIAQILEWSHLNSTSGINPRFLLIWRQLVAKICLSQERTDFYWDHILVPGGFWHTYVKSEIWAKAWLQIVNRFNISTSPITFRN